MFEEYEEIELKLLALNNESILILNDFQKVFKECAIEIMIFNSAIIRVSLSKMLDQEIHFKIFGKYRLELIDHLKRMDIEGLTNNPCNFVDKRLLFYSNEYEEMFSETWLPSKLYHLFYEEPIIANEYIPKEVDLTSLMLFRLPLTEMIKMMQDGTYQIIKENI